MGEVVGRAMVIVGASYVEARRIRDELTGELDLRAPNLAMPVRRLHGRPRHRRTPSQDRRPSIDRWGVLSGERPSEPSTFDVGQVANEAE
jgi:hypothetical protein